MRLEDAFEQVDRIADRTFAAWRVPGVAYGVVVDGHLRHSRKVTLGRAIAGDGQRHATFRLDGTRGHIDLELERDPSSRRLTKVRLRPERLAPAAFD